MKKFLCAFLLTLAVAFAGCEPAGNSGNSGSNGSNSSGNADGTNPDGTNPDGTNPDGNGTNPDGTNPDGNGTNPGGADLLTADTGKWDVGQWQYSLEQGNYGGAIGGATSVTAFCIWANQYFPNGINSDPNTNSSEGAWALAVWNPYLETHPDVKDNFPGDWEKFFEWARTNFDKKLIPTLPRFVVVGGSYGQFYNAPWNLGAWQRYVDATGSGLPGVTSLKSFIQWANANFSAGGYIPSVPDGAAPDTPAWDAAAWEEWFKGGTGIRAFPGTWATFSNWVKKTYGDGNIPSTPPGMTAGNSGTDGNAGDSDSSADGSTTGSDGSGGSATDTPSLGEVIDNLVGKGTGGSAGNVTTGTANSAANGAATPAVLDGSSGDKSFADSGMDNVK